MCQAGRLAPFAPSNNEQHTTLPSLLQTGARGAQAPCGPLLLGGSFLEAVPPSVGLGQPSPLLELVRRCSLNIDCILVCLRMGAIGVAQPALISPSLLLRAWQGEVKDRSKAGCLTPLSTHSLCPLFLLPQTKVTLPSLGQWGGKKYRSHAFWTKGIVK